MWFLRARSALFQRRWRIDLRKPTVTEVPRMRTQEVTRNFPFFEPSAVLTKWLNSSLLVVPLTSPTMAAMSLLFFPRVTVSSDRSVETVRVRVCCRCVDLCFVVFLFFPFLTLFSWRCAQRTPKRKSTQKILSFCLVRFVLRAFRPWRCTIENQRQTTNDITEEPRPHPQSRPRHVLDRFALSVKTKDKDDEDD